MNEVNEVNEAIHKTTENVISFIKHEITKRVIDFIGYDDDLAVEDQHKVLWSLYHDLATVVVMTSQDIIENRTRYGGTYSVGFDYADERVGILRDGEFISLSSAVGLLNEFHKTAREKSEVEVEYERREMENGYYFFRTSRGNKQWAICWVNDSNVHFFGAVTQRLDSEYVTMYVEFGKKVTIG